MAENNIDTIKEKLDNVETITDINDILKSIHPSDRYHIINTEVCNPHRTRIASIIDIAKNIGDKSYQEYQALKMEAEESYKHDNTPAKMIDVDMAVTRAYTILVKMIGIINKEVNMSQEAINKIEEELKLKLTRWGEDNEPVCNEQGEQDSAK